MARVGLLRYGAGREELAVQFNASRCRPVEVTYLSPYFLFLSLFTTITKLHLQYNEDLTTAPTEPFKNNLTQEVNFYSVGKTIPVPAWTGPEGSSNLRPPVFKTDDTKRWQSCQPYASAAFSLQKVTLVLSHPRAIV